MLCYYQPRRVGCALPPSFNGKEVACLKLQKTCECTAWTPQTPTGRIVYSFPRDRGRGEGDGAGTEPMSPPLSPPRHLRGQNPTNTSDLQWKDVSPPDPKEQSPCFLPSPKEGRRSAVAPDPRSTGRWTAPDLKRQVSSSHIPHSLSPEGRCLHLRTAAGAPDLRAGRYFSERETRGAGPRVGVP